MLKRYEIIDNTKVNYHSLFTCWNYQFIIEWINECKKNKEQVGQKPSEYALYTYNHDTNKLLSIEHVTI